MNPLTIAHRLRDHRGPADTVMSPEQTTRYRGTRLVALFGWATPWRFPPT